MSYGLILLWHCLIRQEVLLRKRAVNGGVLGFRTSVIYYLTAAAKLVNIGRGLSAFVRLLRAYQSFI